MRRRSGLTPAWDGRAGPRQGRCKPCLGKTAVDSADRSAGRRKQERSGAHRRDLRMATRRLPVSRPRRQVQARLRAVHPIGSRLRGLREGGVAVAVVKSRGSLTLYLDGQEVASCSVPEHPTTMASELGIGFNPFFHGGERFIGAIARVRFYDRAFSREEVEQATRLR